MIDLTGVKHHPAIEEIVDVLCSVTEKTDKSFFRVIVAHFLGKMAGSMRASVITKNRGPFLVNIYALALATSGFGKGLAMNVLEDILLSGFSKRFLSNTMETVSDQTYWQLASERAARTGNNDADEYEKIKKESESAGHYPFTFDKATEAAVKQLRQKLILMGIGAINLQIDEIGSNLIKEADALKIFLELFDQGKVKQSLRKNSNDNKRGQDIESKTPTNMLLFGTQDALLDGDQTEAMFYNFLEIGYARRCLFGLGVKEVRSLTMLDPDQLEKLWDESVDPQQNPTLAKWADRFHSLADPARYNWTMQVGKDVGIALLSYHIQCEIEANKLKDHEKIRKAEMEHRFSKALKLAGAYAFVDGSNEVEMDHLLSAILLVEESGQAFEKILTREKAHVRLGKFIADMGIDLTHHDLNEALPFYKGSAPYKAEMMNMAMSWGYKNNVIIKKRHSETGTELYRGESIKSTDLDKLKLSFSNHFAYNYEPVEVPFYSDDGECLRDLALAPDMHWANHHFKNNHRSDQDVIPGFNMLVLDVDGGISTSRAHDLLSDYKFMTYTTKSSTLEENRFRLILPINYVLDLDKDDYRELVASVIQWLPLPKAGIDEASLQRSKKWMSCDTGVCHYNLEGELFDILPFIPKTTKNEQFQTGYKAIASLDTLERWFAQKMGGVGSGRNNQMIKFALALVDSGMDLPEVIAKVRAFDRKLPSPIGDDELSNSIFVTVGRRYSNQKAA